MPETVKFIGGPWDGRQIELGPSTLAVGIEHPADWEGHEVAFYRFDIKTRVYRFSGFQLGTGPQP